MLRLTVSPEEYLMINDNIKIVFLGGTQNHLRIMVDAPKEVNIQCDHHHRECGQTLISHGNNRRKSEPVRARRESSYSGYYKN